MKYQTNITISKNKRLFADVDSNQQYQLGYEKDGNFVPFLICFIIQANLFIIKFKPKIAIVFLSKTSFLM